MATGRNRSEHEAIVRYWRTIFGHRYAILAAFVVCVSVAAMVAFLLPPVYRATALVLVEHELSEIADVVGAQSSDIGKDSYYNTQCRLIKSRGVLRAAASRLQLDRWEEFKGSNDIVTALEKRVKVTQVRNTNLIQVSFDGSDRTTVDDVVNAVVECYREKSVQRRKKSSERAAGWLEEQLPKLRSELAAARERLWKFQKENRLLALPRVVRRESKEAQRETGIAWSSESQEIILQRLAQLSEALTTAECERIRLEARASLVEDAGNASAENRLAVARAEEEALRAALTEEQARVLELQKKFLELETLQREVERVTQLHEPMLERATKLAVLRDLNPATVQIIDPAEEPRKKIKPRRRLILAAGALLGLLAGLRLAFLLGPSRASVRSPEKLED